MESIRYRITIRGRLSERFGSAFDGMTLLPAAGNTILVGELTDQADLYGLLDRRATSAWSSSVSRRSVEPAR